MRGLFCLLGLTGCHLAFELAPPIDAPMSDAPMSDDAQVDYAAAVLADGPVAYWRLGAGSASAVDVTGNGNTGTFLGGVEPGAPGALVGDPDVATDFDGDDDVVVMGDRLSFEGSLPFTIEAWARPTAHVNYTGIVSKTDELSGGSIKSGYMLFDHFERFGCERSDGADTQHVSTGPLSLNQWTYVVATFDGGTLTLYVDAVEQDSSTTPIVIPATSKPFAVGARNGGTWLWFNGSIDEVAIYDRALDRTQLEAHRRLALGE